MSHPPASVHSGVPNSTPVPRKIRPQPPQKTVEDFWDAFTTKHPGKVLNILPKNVYAKSKAAHTPKGTVYAQDATKSYEDARAECIAAVQQVSRECRRVNMRYRDPHFDIEFDLKDGPRRCLDGIGGFDPKDSPRPRAVKRVHDIFKNPKFYVDGAAAADVRQGKTGDCYFLAAVGALGNKQGLIDRVCIARDEEVGVYGFVFHRDGGWMHTVIDDKLYLSIADYDESRAEKSNWSEIMNRQDAEQEYIEAFQTGSRALYFAQCNDENETWLPLLEKAYAKAHGDYYSIIGGFTGEAIEDLTGGVTTELFGSDILNKDKFWNEELKHVGTKFLFGCATGRFDDWQDGTSTAWRQGIVSTHAYTILRANTFKGERLVLVRNPWGQAEWSGRWSDGSEQWTAESIQALDHKFGDDGMFWISFEDLLRKYQFFDRTRLFDDSWKVTQQWTSVDVHWTADYNETKFSLTLSEKSPIVLVLSQLDDRYFMGLEGQYTFSLHFRVDREGADTYEVRSHGNYWMSRSVSTEVDLEPGTYNVFIKVRAERDLKKPRVEDVVRQNCKQNPEKLLQVGLAYDLAHAKGVVAETEGSKQARAEAKERAKAKAKKEAVKKARAAKYRKWQVEAREIERERREKARADEHKKKKRQAKEDKAAEAEKRKKAAAEAEEEAGKTKENQAEQKKDAPEVAPSDDIPAIVASPTEAKASETVSSIAVQTEESPETSDLTKAPDSDAGVVSLPSMSQPSTETEAFKPSQAAEESGWVVESKPAEDTNRVASQVEADSHANPAASTAQPVPGVPTTELANLTIVDPDPATDAPPLSPAAMSQPPPSVAATERTVITFNSSVDSLLDLALEDSDSDGLADGDGTDVDQVDSDNEEFANDPWNAVCVVGLRVYSKNGEVSVGVVRPKTTEDDDDTPLDVDDPSKAVADDGSLRAGAQDLPPRGILGKIVSEHVVTNLDSVRDL